MSGRTRGQGLLTASIVGVVVTGCGGYKAGTQGLTACMRDNAGARSSQPISVRPPGAAARATPATAAIEFDTGGPSGSGQHTVDANINTENVYVFADSASARQAASRAGPALARGAAASGAPTSAVAIGRTVLVYIGGQQVSGGLPIQPEDLAAARKCVHAAGYG